MFLLKNSYRHNLTSEAPQSPKLNNVRVRIAPSPTGDPHIGTAYIALFNYVFAKQHGGKFIIRIEDTDRSRYRKMSEDMILGCLKWLGIEWDEGPDIGGMCETYRQSERLELYHREIKQLIKAGHAYHCFCTPERLDEVKKKQAAEKSSILGYDRKCRDMSPEEVEQKLADKVPFVIRMKAPLAGKTVFYDRLRQNIEFDNTSMDDQVLIKSDGFPTYHFAAVVDDHHMQISHVIRGEEWISSTPKHVVLYNMFGWNVPEFCHLNLLRNADKSKVSKRKNPTSINYYRRKGILPEVLLNFLALMGWNMGDDKEIFSLSEMISHFSWERFSLGGPVFDLQKLSWLNGQYLRAMSEDNYIKYLREELFSEAYLRQIVPLVRERVEKFEDWVSYNAFFFAGDLVYTDASMVPKGKTPAETATVLLEILDAIEAIETWNHTELHNALEQYNTKKAFKPKDTFMPLRIAVTGRKETPPLFETMEVLGKEIVRRRMRLAASYLQSLPKA